MLVQRRFWIEQIDLAGAAILKQLDYRFGPRLELRLARFEVVDSPFGGLLVFGLGSVQVLAQQVGQRYAQQAVADL